MTEPKDKIRWDICEECASSGKSFGLNMQEQILDFITSHRKEEWENPLFAHYSGFYSYFNSKRHQLCRGCPFAMEHTIAAQKVVTEYKFGK